MLTLTKYLLFIQLWIFFWSVLTPTDVNVFTYSPTPFHTLLTSNSRISCSYHLNVLLYFDAELVLHDRCLIWLTTWIKVASSIIETLLIFIEVNCFQKQLHVTCWAKKKTCTQWTEFKLQNISESRIRNEHEVHIWFFLLPMLFFFLFHDCCQS